VKEGVSGKGNKSGMRKERGEEVRRWWGEIITNRRWKV